MVAPDEPEREAPRARHALWLRLALYGGALVLALLLLAARSGDGPPEVRTYSGPTGQGHRFFAGLRDDRVTFFDTVVTGRCSIGSVWNFHWIADEERPDPFVTDGDRLRVTHAGPRQYSGMTSQIELGLDATVTGDELRGVLRYRERFTPQRGEPFECAAEGIRFTVQR